MPAPKFPNWFHPSAAGPEAPTPPQPTRATYFVNSGNEVNADFYRTIPIPPGATHLILASVNEPREEASIQFGTLTESANPDYQAELDRYAKDLDEYEARKAAWPGLVERWRRKQLADARALVTRLERKLAKDAAARKTP